MRAARIHAYGEPDELRIEDIDPPAVGPRDVLIDVHAAGVNPIDWKIRRGYQRGVLRYKLPRVLGLDCSGVVREVGDKVTKFAVGDEVFSSPGPWRDGTYAEQVCIPEKEIAKKPANISHAQAAGIPLAGLTALQCIDAGKVGDGDKVLVHAGAGGVGTLAIQLAKAAGASEIATTCSARNAELVTSLGATRVIDYNREEFDDVVSDYDMVLDALGGDIKKRSQAVLRRGGALVSIVNDIPSFVKRYGATLGVVVALGSTLSYKIGCALRGKSYTWILRKPDGALLGRLASFIERGEVEPLIDKVFGLDEIAEAHRYSETGRARGKIIIGIRSDTD